jgi:formate-dependent nitrite reductase membrane component NrfD
MANYIEELTRMRSKRYLGEKQLKFIPNKIPMSSRIISIIFSIALLSYGTYSIAVNKFTIPFYGRDGSNGIVYLYDGAAIIMYISFLLYTLMMLAHVTDHYDKRDNESKYFIFKFVMIYLSMLFFIGAFIYGLVFNESHLTR